MLLLWLTTSTHELSITSSRLSIWAWFLHLTLSLSLWLSFLFGLLLLASVIVAHVVVFGKYCQLIMPKWQANQLCFCLLSVGNISSSSIRHSRSANANANANNNNNNNNNKVQGKCLLQNTWQGVQLPPQLQFQATTLSTRCRIINTPLSTFLFPLLNARRSTWAARASIAITLPYRQVAREDKCTLYIIQCTKSIKNV